MTNQKNESIEMSASNQITFPSSIQDIVMDYLGGDITEGQPNIYSAKNSSCLFEGGSKENPYDRLALVALLGHVVKGEQDQAEMIIRTNPALLFKYGTIKDKIGNIFVHYSPCELASYMHDTDMLAMMKLYLDESNKMQFKKILSDTYEAFQAQQPYDFSLLVASIMEGDTQEALASFKKEFEPKEIKKEKSFNIATIMQAYDVYVNNYYPWTAQQCSLFWREVIGYCQRLLPADYVQAFCQGLYNVAANGEPLKREFALKNGSNFYSYCKKEKKGLGFDFGLHSYSYSGPDNCSEDGESHPAGWERVRRSGDMLREYIQQKMKNLKNLYEHDESYSLSRVD